MAQVSAGGSRQRGQGKAVEDFVVVIFGRTDRFVFWRRECFFDESEVALRMVAQRRTNSDISAKRQKGEFIRRVSPR